MGREMHRVRDFILAFFIVSTGIHSSFCEFMEMTSLLAQQVADDYFSNEENCITLIADAGYLSFRSSNPTIRLNFNRSDEGCDPNLENSLKYSIKMVCTMYIVQISEPTCFFPAWYRAHHYFLYERQNPKIFVLPVKDATTNSDTFFSMNETNLVSNILWAEESTGEENWPIVLYTNNFYELVQNPNRTVKIYINEWSITEGLRHDTSLFPEKLRDLRQKPMRLFAVSYMPYASPDPLQGVEVQIVREYCKIHNCQVIGVNNDGDDWGSLSDDGFNNTGEMGALFRDDADIGVGSNTVWLQFWPHIDFSDCYQGAAMLLIVPKPNVIGGWFTPFLPFSLTLWVLVIFTVTIAALSILCFTKATVKLIPSLGKQHLELNHFLSFTDSIMRAMGMLVLQQTSVSVRGSPVRHLFTSFEIIFFIMTTLYTAELFDYLTVPRTEKPIDTLGDIVENDLPWLGYDDAWIYGLLNAEDSVTKQFTRLFKKVPMESIAHIAEGGGHGVPIERMVGGNFVLLPYITEKFISRSRLALGGNIYGMTPITLILQKGSPYTQSLNRLLGHMQNGGLYYAWEAYSARLYTNFTMQQILGHSSKVETPPPKVLGLSDLEGAFLIYFIGLTLALITFLFERLRTATNMSEYKGQAQR